MDKLQSLLFASIMVLMFILMYNNEYIYVDRVSKIVSKGVLFRDYRYLDSCFLQGKDKGVISEYDVYNCGYGHMLRVRTTGK